MAGTPKDDVQAVPLPLAASSLSSATSDAAPAGPLRRRPSAPLRNRLETAAIGLTMTTTAVLALRGLGGRSLWLDEGVVGYAATGSIRRFVDWMTIEPEFVLYGLIVRAFAQVSATEFALRLPTTIFAVLSIPVVFAVARRLFGGRAAVIAGVLVSVNGYFLGYAQEARPYAMLVLTSTAATLCLLRALDHPERSRGWSIWLLVSTLAVLTHPFGLAMVAAHVLILLCRRSVPWRELATLAILPAGVMGALAVTLLELGPARLSWIAPAGKSDFVNMASLMAGSRSPGPLLGYCAGAAVLMVALIRPAAHRRGLRASAAIAGCLMATPVILMQRKG